MKTRTEEDGDLICEAIAAGADTASKIRAATGLSVPRYDRLVPQLRKAGRIVSKGGRWSVVAANYPAPRDEI